jgi:protein-disulfide isomerase
MSIPLIFVRSLVLSAALSLGPGGCNAKKVNGEAWRDASPQTCERLKSEVCKEAKGDSEACTSLETAVAILPPEVCDLALGDLDYVRKKLSERKETCTELATKLCHDVGDKSRSCNRVQAQSKKFTPERCIGMLRQYAEVLTNLKEQRAHYQLPPEKAAKLTAGDPPAFGPANAKLQLVEFIDFENRDCVRAAAIVRELKAEYGDELHFVVRQFPLPYNPHAHLAAEASLAAYAQGKFWELHDKLLANQQKLDRASLEGYAKEIQLDLGQFDAAIDQKKYAPAVDADKALGDELSVVGMPTMFLDGERLLNAVDKAAITEAIEDHLSVTN